MEKKKKEQEQVLQKEADREKATWFDNLVGPGKPTWVREKEERIKQEEARMREAMKTPQSPQSNPHLLSLPSGGKSAADNCPKPQVRLY